MQTESGAQDFAKISAMIEANFGMDVGKMSDEDFAVYGAKAMWIESYRAELVAVKLSEIVLKMLS